MTEEDERRLFAVPPAEGLMEGIELALLDRQNEDDRYLLALAEHPDLQRPVREHQREIMRDNTVMSPQLHIIIHQVVASQLWDDEPPEMWQTAKRLTAAGYDRHEIFHMLGSVVSYSIYRALQGEYPGPEERNAALAALPESWEQQREEKPEAFRRNRTVRRTSKKHRHR